MQKCQICWQWFQLVSTSFNIHHQWTSCSTSRSRVAPGDRVSSCQFTLHRWPRPGRSRMSLKGQSWCGFGTLLHNDIVRYSDAIASLAVSWISWCVLFYLFKIWNLYTSEMSKAHTLPLLATGIPIPPGITSPRHQRRVSRSPRSHESTAMWWIRCSWTMLTMFKYVCSRNIK